MRRRVLSWLLIVITVLSSIVGSNCVVFAKESENYKYALLSFSNNNPMVIEANGGNLGGDIASNSTIRIGNMNKNCKIYENISHELPILFEALEEKYFINSKKLDSTESVSNNFIYWFCELYEWIKYKWCGKSLW